MSMYGNNLDEDPTSATDVPMQDMQPFSGADFMNDSANALLSFDLGLGNGPDSSHDVKLGQSLNFSTADDPSLNAPLTDYNIKSKDGSIVDNSSEVGAGPMPRTHGVDLPPNVGSSLTEFTKRRNWSQRIVEELKDFLYILTPDQRLIYVSPSAKALTGHDASELVGKFMLDFVHPDDQSMFIREFHESIATGHPLRFFFRFRRPNDTWAIFESLGHPHYPSDVSNFGGTDGQISFCRGFFMMARPYPTKNAALLDSFLEHKIENEQLKKRIADLKKEEREETQPAQAVRQDRSRPSTLQQQSSAGSPNTAHGSNFDGMPPPPKLSPTNTSLTRRNLNEALLTSQPDSITDKMARYEGSTHVEGIEVLTGLRYREGERAQGISTGEKSPVLMKGDQGIDIPVDKDGRPVTRRYSVSPYGDEAEKKKKLKVADEYVCTDWGTLDSPEWRRGPTGPKTLCNACGLRWAKKEKKRGGGNNNNGDDPTTLSQTKSGDSSVRISNNPSPVGHQDSNIMSAQQSMSGASIAPSINTGASGTISEQHPLAPMQNATQMASSTGMPLQTSIQFGMPPDMSGQMQGQ